MAIAIRTHLADPTCHAAAQKKVASFARRAADNFKRADPSFSYEWFFGACGLDNWGEVLSDTHTAIDKPLKWDSEISDFRSD